MPLEQITREEYLRMWRLEAELRIDTKPQPKPEPRPEPATPDKDRFGQIDT